MRDRLLRLNAARLAYALPLVVSTLVAYVIERTAGSCFSPVDAQARNVRNRISRASAFTPRAVRGRDPPWSRGKSGRPSRREMAGRCEDDGKDAQSK